MKYEVAERLTLGDFEPLACGLIPLNWALAILTYTPIIKLIASLLTTKSD